MEQLSKIDYATLQMEHARFPQHISTVMFYDQPNVRGRRVRFKSILQFFESAASRSTVLRRKLGGSTGGFDTPYWLDDPDFNVEYHVHHIALPQPGDWRQLCIMLARIHSRSVDMTRPPWEAYVIEGLNKVAELPRKSFAIMLKIHHSAVDGMAVMELVKTLHSVTDDPTPPPVLNDWQNEPPPTQQAVWSHALQKFGHGPGKLVETLREVVPRLVELRRHTPPAEAPQHKCKTRFNTRISQQRVVDAVILDLDRVKAVRRTLKGATVNDVILSVVGGALRQYLLAKDDLPETSIYAGAPVSLREPDEDGSRGNKVGLLRVSLATDVADPIDRLRAVCKSTRDAKQRAADMGIKDIMGLIENVSPALLAASMKLQGLSGKSLSDFISYQTGVTNMPGPANPLFLAGAKLHMLMCMGPLTDGLGLGNFVMSCADTITITCVSCRELMPDPEFYRECLQNAWEELESAAAANSKKKAGPV